MNGLGNYRKAPNEYQNGLDTAENDYKITH